jgi:hypothetical protein
MARVVVITVGDKLLKPTKKPGFIGLNLALGPYSQYPSQFCDHANQFFDCIYPIVHRLPDKRFENITWFS